MKTKMLVKHREPSVCLLPLEIVYVFSQNTRGVLALLHQVEVQWLHSVRTSLRLIAVGYCYRAKRSAVPELRIFLDLNTTVYSHWQVPETIGQANSLQCNSVPTRIVKVSKSPSKKLSFIPADYVIITRSNANLYDLYLRETRALAAVKGCFSIPAATYKW